MNPPASPSPPSDDHHDARTRLIDAGLRLFAAQGFAKTSTRELAEAASVNVASISYYFGDKAGLYRAVFFEPSGGSPAEDIARLADPALPLPAALRAFYDSFLEPLKQGDQARLCMKLRFREILEPTGLWDDELANVIQPMHEALLGVLCRHLGLPRETASADDDLQRLAICIAGLGVHLHVGTDINEQIAPGLMAGPDALDRWSQRLTDFALAMVRDEAERRGPPVPAAGATSMPGAAA